MSRDTAAMGQHPPEGAIAYLQLPATDVARSAAFYAAAFGWSADGDHGDFEAPGMIGHPARMDMLRDRLIFVPRDIDSEPIARD